MAQDELKVFISKREKQIAAMKKYNNHNEWIEVYQADVILAQILFIQNKKKK